METVGIETLRDFGIEGATRDPKNTGVWVGDKKVAAIGISASKWITTHGVALNVQPDLSYFDTSVILPCGIEGKQVTSMAELLMEQQQQQDTASGSTASASDGDDDVSSPNCNTVQMRIPTMQEVAAVVTKKFEQVFNVQTVEAKGEDLKQ
ncbi:MAG: hypothetical protein SGILL_008235 [Bacillariaceae sp.]